MIDLLDARISPLDHEIHSLALTRASNWTRSPASAICSSSRRHPKSARTSSRRTAEEIAGPEGRLTGRLLERALAAELTEHLGYNWNAALAALEIHFGDRIPDAI